MKRAVPPRGGTPPHPRWGTGRRGGSSRYLHSRCLGFSERDLNG